MKKALSIVIAMAMTLSLLTLGAAAKGTYSDTQGTWAEAAIERWSGYGMIQGNNGKFDPNGDLTRGQMATMLTRLLKLAAAESAGFSDITDETWCADAVNRCAAAGIMLGNNGKAMPNAPITRQEAMVMLARALGVAPITDTKALAKFADADKVGTFAQGYLAALVEAGIVKGTAEGKLDPLSNITRAEMVTIVDRLIAHYADTDGMTVDAKDGGLVLVVAKNVKVVNAPEGTKVVVAKDAAGLTVNGVDVAGGQIYVVPGTVSGGGNGGGPVVPDPGPGGVDKADPEESDPIEKPDDPEEKTDEPEKVVIIDGKEYYYDADKDEYYTMDGDEKVYVDMAQLQKDAEEKGVIIVDGKEYYYDDEEEAWYPADGDEEEAGLTFEEVIGGGNTSEEVDD